MVKKRICPFDDRICDAKDEPHDIGEWVTGVCKYGKYSEEDDSRPPCDSRFRINKISKVKTNRKIIKKCRCK